MKSWCHGRLVVGSSGRLERVLKQGETQGSLHVVVPISNKSYQRKEAIHVQIYTMEGELSEQDQIHTQEKIRRTKNKVRTLVSNAKQRKGEPLPSREEVNGFDLEEGDYVDYFRYMVRNKELPESELYDVENLAEEDFFGPFQDFIPTAVRSREASGMSQENGELLDQNGTELDQDTEKGNETTSEMTTPAQGAGTLAQGV